ncbi:cell division protein ZapA [Nitrobacteraceae bacterium UC4446_H13]|jgi:cell division protein ZapA|nr:cell division protein ZapA [Hyphomicrobiales bacterium]
MNHINVTINGRQYRMACEDGQEQRLMSLADGFEARIGELRGKFGEIGDARLTVMAALMVADELLDANERIRALQGEVASLGDVRVAAAERNRATQYAVSAALNAAAERIEKTTQVLNRTVGNGIAIG